MRRSSLTLGAESSTTRMAAPEGKAMSGMRHFPAFVDKALDHFRQLTGVHRLAQVAVESRIEKTFFVAFHRLRGNRHRGHAVVGAVGPNRADHVQPAALAEPYVEQQQIRLRTA